MKKTFIVILAAVFISCNSNEKKEATDAMTKTKPDSTMNMSGYTPTYSASFEMGDPKQAEIVFMLWKAWENGDLTPAKTHFADSVEFYTADGSKIAGSLDSTFNTMQTYRNSFSKIGTAIHAIFPVKSTDKNENWVCVWGTEYQTDKNGKVDSIDVQETWRFNKNGKVDLMYQFMRPTTPSTPQPK